MQGIVDERSLLHSQGQEGAFRCCLSMRVRQYSSFHVLASRTSLALNYGVCGISVDWPRTPNFQQPLNY
jgi:hypothetical protein